MLHIRPAFDRELDGLNIAIDEHISFSFRHHNGHFQGHENPVRIIRTRAQVNEGW
jgi:hypothetical protein